VNFFTCGDELFREESFGKAKGWDMTGDSNLRQNFYEPLRPKKEAKRSGTLYKEMTLQRATVMEKTTGVSELP